MVGLINSGNEEGIQDLITQVSNDLQLSERETNDLRHTGYSALQILSARRGKDYAAAARGLRGIHTGQIPDEAHEALRRQASTTLNKILERKLSDARASADPEEATKSGELAMSGFLSKEEADAVMRHVESAMGEIVRQRMEAARASGDPIQVLEAQRWAQAGTMGEGDAREIERQAKIGLIEIADQRYQDAVEAGDADALFKLVDWVRKGLVQDAAADRLMQGIRDGLRQLGRQDLLDRLEEEERRRREEAREELEQIPEPIIEDLPGTEPEEIPDIEMPRVEIRKDPPMARAGLFVDGVNIVLMEFDPITAHPGKEVPPPPSGGIPPIRDPDKLWDGATRNLAIRLHLPIGVQRLGIYDDRILNDLEGVINLLRLVILDHNEEYRVDQNFQIGRGGK
jgi:hypothetical protein